MNYTEIVKALNNASTFDLFRLSIAIQNLLKDPGRLQEIKDKLSIGQAVEYFDPESNTLVSGSIYKLGRTKVGVIVDGTRERWVMPLSWINLDQVDTTITYMRGLTFDLMRDHAFDNNVTVLQNEGLLRNAEYGIRVEKSALIPSLGIRAQYNYNEGFNAPTDFSRRFRRTGPTVNASLAWNIFDGGLSKVRIQNSKIAAQNQEVARQQNLQVLDRNVNNAWAFYENALFVLEAEKKNLLTNQRNFERTLEQQKLGQITSIEFRQAQLNLLNAQLNFNQAKYSAKTAELALLQISGDLMEAEF